MCSGAQIAQGPDDVSQLLQKELPCPGSASCGPPVLLVQKPFNLVSLLSSPAEQRVWDRTNKPKDPDSRLLAVLLSTKTHSRAFRWPLLLDPDKQALVWLLTAGALDEGEQGGQVPGVLGALWPAVLSLKQPLLFCFSRRVPGVSLRAGAGHGGTGQQRGDP